MNKRGKTMKARAKWCGPLLVGDDLPLTRRQVHFLRKGGLIRESMTWQAWDDEFNTRQPNGKAGVMKSPAAYGFGFLNYLREHRQSGRRWLYLSGPCGMGKTHLAVILAATWAVVEDVRLQWSTYSRVPARLVNWGLWLNARRDSYGDRELKVSLAPLIEVPLLVLDDVGLEMTAHSLKHLYYVLEARRGKVTIITSNLSLADMQKALFACKEGAADWAMKVASRLGKGKGGNVLGEVQVTAPQSYREV